MSYFAVIREAGPVWQDGGISHQPDVEEHAAFMNALAERGVVLFGGPLAGSEHGHLRVLLIAHADSDDEIRQQLAGDPWEQTKRLTTVSVEPWRPLVSEERLPPSREAKSS